MFFKAFIALAAVAAATASVVSTKRQDDAGIVSCNLLLKPIVHADSSTTNLFAEFNLLVGRSLAEDANPGGSEEINNGNGTTVLAENADNTFLIDFSISAAGKTAAESGAIITAWVGETKVGSTTNWTILSATCDA